MSEDYRDDMTLDEIGDNDLEMAKEAIKNAKRYKFHHPSKAAAFVVHAIHKTLLRCGVKISKGMDGKMAQRILDVQKVQIETRERYPEGEDYWRNGTYIYKDGELVAFISTVIVVDRRIVTLDRFHVVTNAKV